MDEELMLLCGAIRQLQNHRTKWTFSCSLCLERHNVLGRVHSDQAAHEALTRVASADRGQHVLHDEHRSTGPLVEDRNTATRGVSVCGRERPGVHPSAKLRFQSVPRTRQHPGSQDQRNLRLNAPGIP